MNIIITKGYQEMAREAARLIAKEMLKKPNMILGLATGSTPEKVYAELIELYNNGIISFKDITSFNLDEYVGLAKTHDQSYYYYMMENLFNHIDMDKENINILDGKAINVEQECKSYEEKISKAGGIDLQLLGIGRNGHIAFNEPSDKIEANTRLVNLTEDTIEANARFFESQEDVPTKALTMGIKPIMNAKKIIIIANGEDKAKAIYDAVNGPVDPKVPASLLQLHNDVTLIVDDQAGKLL